MRGSLKELLHACQEADIAAAWLGREEDSKSCETELEVRIRNSHWLHHVQKVLLGALDAAKKIGRDNESVLIHCSDGWDRTAQLTALAQVILDSRCRTIDGFIVSGIFVDG